MEIYKNSTDEDLVGLFKEGVDQAFEELYNRYAPKIKRLIYYYITNVDDVDDIFHEVIVRVIRHINSFDTTLSFSSWFYQIAVNCCKNYINNSIKRDKIISKEKDRISIFGKEPLNTEEHMINNYDMQEFNIAIDGLKDKFKDVFILRFDHKMKYSEIAEVLNCSERTAKWRMKKAIEKITQHLKEQGLI